MSRTALRQLWAGALFVGAGLVGFVTPAYACQQSCVTSASCVA